MDELGSLLDEIEEWEQMVSLTPEERAELYSLCAGTVEDMFDNHRKLQEKKEQRIEESGEKLTGKEKQERRKMRDYQEGKPHERKSLRKRLAQKKREADEWRERTSERQHVRECGKDRV